MKSKIKYSKINSLPDPEKYIPAKPDSDPDPTKHRGDDPEKNDPTRTDDPAKKDPTRIDPIPVKPTEPGTSAFTLFK